jgi:hypothetical protein
VVVGLLDVGAVIVRNTTIRVERVGLGKKIGPLKKKNVNSKQTASINVL